jgi:hypothetical protein
VSASRAYIDTVNRRISKFDAKDVEGMRGKIIRRKLNTKKYKINPER